MNNTIKVFEHEGNSVRTITEDGEIYFVAKDIAQALGYAEGSNPARLIQSVPEFWKGVKRFHTPGGEQEMLCLTEQGLYFFLGRSDKPAALDYQVWIAGEVVPSIRKHGMYATPQTVDQIIADPDSFIKILLELKAERAKSTALNEQIEAQKPKVLFAEAVETSKGSILIGDLAKLIKQNGIDIGQKRLFSCLRNHGYLIRQQGESRNMPTQKSMDLQLFEVKERTVNNPDGTVRITKTTKVTGKGQVYFINKFLSGEIRK